MIRFLLMTIRHRQILLTYDGAAATMVEQTPVQDQEQEATQDENLAEPEVNLPDQDEYLKED